MSSRSGGSGNKKKSFGGTANNVPSSPTGKDGRDQTSSNQQDFKGRGGENGFVPLESRLMEIRDPAGKITQVPALDKRWAPSMNYIEFYLPSCATLLEDEMALFTWCDYMDMYCKDLRWLLSVPHHQFWSVLVYSPQVSHLILHSFLLRSPQWFDKEFQMYLEHEVIGPRYQEIYSLVFRVFLRLCTHKESKKDFISPITWASLLVDQQIVDILKLQNLCSIYESENNQLLPKMIENVLKNCPKLVACFRNLIPALLSTTEEMTEELQKRIRESSSTNMWKLESYEELLAFFLNTTCGLYKLCKAYTPAAEIVMTFHNALIQLASTYEPNCCKLWGQVIVHLPSLEERVKVLRVLLIRLFRTALANPTINEVTSSNDHRIDAYFEVLTNCLDEKTFIRDYEKAYPFKQDINALLSRGVFIDETRIDYIANAISSCFNACGEDYAVEKIVVDPLYDPNFDRQLLGACSLDVTGVELQSLVTQVKDILPEIPDSYVEAVLKHYGYQAEVAINALLEGSVPARLEKYKSESYVQTLKNSSGSHKQVGTQDTELEKLASKLVIKDASVEAERFYAGKRRHGFDETSRDFTAIDKNDSEWLQPKINELVAKSQEETAYARENSHREITKRGRDAGRMEQGSNDERYVDESLLPSFRNTLEYEDEYDDTYDELGVGMTEPDNIEIKPLNQKKMQASSNANDEDDDEEQSGNDKRLDFCEDPAIVRARFERRREEKSQQHHRRGGGGGGPPPPSGDVVGKAKGQGQEKDVVYARRQKNINKDSGGFKKKRADFKRREF